MQGKNVWPPACLNDWLDELTELYRRTKDAFPNHTWTTKSPDYGPTNRKDMT